MSAGDMSGEALACLITKSRDWFAVFRNDVTDLVVGTYSRVHDRYSPRLPVRHTIYGFLSRIRNNIELHALAF